MRAAEAEIIIVRCIPPVPRRLPASTLWCIGIIASEHSRPGRPDLTVGLTHSRPHHSRPHLHSRSHLSPYSRTDTGRPGLDDFDGFAWAEWTSHHWEIPITACVVYLVGIYLLKRFMAERKPIRLQPRPV